MAAAKVVVEDAEKPTNSRKHKSHNWISRSMITKLEFIEMLDEIGIGSYVEITKDTLSLNVIWEGIAMSIDELMVLAAENDCSLELSIDCKNYHIRRHNWFYKSAHQPPSMSNGQNERFTPDSTRFDIGMEVEPDCLDKIASRQITNPIGHSSQIFSI